MLHIIKSGRSYEGMMTAEFSVLLDNRMLARSSELIQVLSCAVAAVYVFNIDFPKNLYQFVHCYFLKLPLQASKTVKKLAVKLSQIE